MSDEIILTVDDAAPIELNISSPDMVRLGISEQIINQGGSLSDEAKLALLDVIQHVAFINGDGQDYYDALYAALYPPVELDYITAVYTQSGTVYDTDSLDDLKTDLVVTAHNSDGTTETVTTYTLSGTLAEGTSTITVSYGGKTTTFNVTVSEVPVPKNLNFMFSDIELSDGYIGDDGTVTSAADNYYYDEFIDAVGFWLVKPNSTVYYNASNLYLRLACYDSSKTFSQRLAVQKGNPAVQTTSSYIKMGFNNGSIVQSNADRFVACNILDTSICTIENKTINTSGVVENNTGSNVSDFLPVNEGAMICQLANQYDSALVVFYDSSKNFISRHAVTSSLTNYQLAMAVPNNAAYVRFRCPQTPNGNIYVSYVRG